MKKPPHVDLLAGLGAVGLALATVILAATGVVDLAEYIAQPEPLFAFGLAALGRWYNGSRVAELEATED
jgi:hypothetical protein